MLVGLHGIRRKMNEEEKEMIMKNFKRPKNKENAIVFGKSGGGMSFQRKLIQTKKMTSDHLSSGGAHAQSYRDKTN